MFLTMIFLFLLQIFNGVDWDCAAGFHSWNSDSSSRAEHRMETTSPADAERSLSAAWQLAGFRTDSFFHFPDPGKHLMISDLPPQPILLREWSSGPPPELLVPWRC